MKKLDFGQTVSILANVGVIAGIAFLALELHQNNELLTAQTQATRLDARRGYNQIFLQNPEVLSAIARARRGEELTDEDHLRLLYVSRTLFSSWQFAFESYRSGLVEEETLPIDAWARDMRGGGDVPRLIDYWNERNLEYDPDFVDFINQRVIGSASE